MDLADKSQVGRSRAVMLGMAWAAALAVTVAAYWPGLVGPFVLDDFSTIASLGNLGGVTDWDTFKAFVFNGTAGPTGRPLALFSFLVDGTNWPTDPWPFKRTNLLIHLVNGVLLGVVTRQVLLLLEFGKERAAWIALASAAAWMLHPFLVSTTLYAVQRMAQLAMLFSLVGMVTYLHGRSLLAVNKVRGYVIMTLSLGVFTLLATLSKENGILLPTLIGVIEITVFASRGDELPPLDRRWAALFLALPTTCIVAYLVFTFFRADFLEVANTRDFSLYERFLTQPRVVADYLQNWFLPKLYTTGVFQDHVIKSTSLFSPMTTFVALVLHIGVIALAFAKRKALPLLAFAILFFYANHLLESTTLNLELYFEHRNYLAAAFLFLPLVVLLADKLDRRAGVLVAGAMLLVLSGFTRYSATVWSDYNGMIQASASKAPTSARAQALFAINLFNANQHEASLQVLDRAIENIPTNDPLLLVNRALILCSLRRLEPSELDQVVAQLASRNYDSRYLQLYSTLVQVVAEPRCPDVSLERVKPLFAGMLDEPANMEPGSLSKSHVHYLNGLVAVNLGEQAAAREQFMAALDTRPDASSAMTMAGLMATHGFLENALMFADVALEQLDIDSAGVRLSAKVTAADIQRFRATVQAEMGVSD
jgi:tetratricopeptide (TPR) repeat protein